MRPCTAVGVLFLIYQLLDVSALYDDAEVNKREAGKLYSRLLVYFFLLLVLQKLNHSKVFTWKVNFQKLLQIIGVSSVHWLPYDDFCFDMPTKQFTKLNKFAICVRNNAECA